MNEELIKRLNDNEDFKKFKEWLAMKTMELDTVDGLSKMTREEAGAQGQSRDIAKTKIFEIMNPFNSIREKIEPSVEEIQIAKGKRGL